MNKFKVSFARLSWRFSETFTKEGVGVGREGSVGATRARKRGREFLATRVKSLPRHWSLALSQGSLVFTVNSYFQSSKGENSSRKTKETSNPGSDISVQFATGVSGGCAAVKTHANTGSRSKRTLFPPPNATVTITLPGPSLSPLNLESSFQRLHQPSRLSPLWRSSVS